LIDNLTLFFQQSILTMDQNLLLNTLTLLLTMLIFWRSIILRKRSVKQATLIKEQSKSLEEIQTQLNTNTESREREEHFQKNLQQAEMTTELQKSRSSFVHQRNSQRPPERYAYARSMFRSGMAANEISSALKMSHAEITQLLKLSSLCGTDEQFKNDKDTLSLA